MMAEDFCFTSLASPWIMAWFGLQTFMSFILVAVLVTLLIKGQYFQPPNNVQHLPNLMLIFMTLTMSALLLLRRWMPDFYCRSFAQLLVIVENLIYISVGTKLFSAIHFIYACKLQFAQQSNKPVKNLKVLVGIFSSNSRLCIAAAYLVISLSLNISWVQMKTDDELCGSPYPERSPTGLLLAYLFPFLVFTLPLLFNWRLVLLQLIEIFLLLVNLFVFAVVSFAFIYDGSDFLAGPGFHLISAFLFMIPIIVFTISVMSSISIDDVENGEPRKRTTNNFSLGTIHDEEASQPLRIPGEDVTVDQQHMRRINNLKIQSTNSYANCPAPMTVFGTEINAEKNFRLYSLSSMERDIIRKGIETLRKEAKASQMRPVFGKEPLNAADLVRACNSFCDIRTTTPPLPILLYLQIGIFNYKNEFPNAWQILIWTCEWNVLVQLVDDDLLRRLRSTPMGVSDPAFVKERAVLIEELDEWVWLAITVCNAQRFPDPSDPL